MNYDMIDMILQQESESDRSAPSSSGTGSGTSSLNSANMGYGMPASHLQLHHHGQPPHSSYDERVFPSSSSHHQQHQQHQQHQHQQLTQESGHSQFSATNLQFPMPGMSPMLLVMLLICSSPALGCFFDPRARETAAAPPVGRARRPLAQEPEIKENPKRNQVLLHSQMALVPPVTVPVPVPGPGASSSHPPQLEKPRRALIFCT